MRNFTTPFLAGVLGSVAALGIAVATTPKAEACGLYWNLAKTEIVVNGNVVVIKNELDGSVANMKA